MEEETKKNKSAGFWADIWDFIRTLLISMLVVFLVAHYIVRPIRVSGNSMYPTLESNALGISNAIGYRISGVDRFDIVIIYLSDKNEYLVKRVVGLPGETISYTDGQLYVNGEAVEEDFLDETYMSTFGDDFMNDIEEITLGEDEYYCLGDNRPNSRDSRYYGAFTSDQIIAKGVVIIYPFDEIGVETW